MMLKKDIIYFGIPFILFCDEKCDKAWGMNLREKNQLSDDDDDYEYLADGELGEAPDDPGSYEGGHAKPSMEEGVSVFDNPNSDRGKLNKWCCRECERSVMIEVVKINDDTDFESLLPDFSKRISNMRKDNDD